MKLFNRRPQTLELSQYVKDIETIARLRAVTAINSEEAIRYTTMIEVMQKIVIRLGAKVK